MEYIYNNQGKVVRMSHDLRGIREHVSKHAVAQVSIWPRWSTVFGYTGEGTLVIGFENGDYYHTHFVSYEVLKSVVRRWRNLYGCPLYVENELGVVAFDSPLLK